jgi:hypothetical protein
MKKIPINQLFTLLLLFILMGCGSGSVSSEETTPVETSSAMPSETADESANPQTENEQASGPVDLCRCLTEPGNSQWAVDNRDACNDAISKELVVG